MRKIFPMLMVLSLFASACQLGGGAPGQPTAIALPDAFSSPTPVPTGESVTNSTGSERTAPGDGMVQVLIPEGTFVMGGVGGKAASDEKPIHQVTMHAFWMDKVEVTNGMYALCVQAGA